jgi:adenylosuccinate lyase
LDATRPTLRYVHFGTTSQDALIPAWFSLRNAIRAIKTFERHHPALVQLSETHRRSTVAVPGQQALPTTFFYITG